MIFRDRLVLGLPRGGVPVAYEVARALGDPLDVFLVRKLGTPGQEELAMGAVATGGTIVLNRHIVEALGVSQPQIDSVVSREQREIARRQHMYRGDRPLPDVRGKTVILVDDGLATGATMSAAVKALQSPAAAEARPARVVVAIPTAAAATCEHFRGLVEEVVCLATPEPFYAVGAWYEDFSQITDEQVRDLLAEGGDGTQTPASEAA